MKGIMAIVDKWGIIAHAVFKILKYSKYIIQFYLNIY
jgi:hypothetical protein